MLIWLIRSIFLKTCWINEMFCAIWYHLQFKKQEKHPWKGDTFSESAGFSLKLYLKYYSSIGVFHGCFLNCTKKWYQIAQSLTNIPYLQLTIENWPNELFFEVIFFIILSINHKDLTTNQNIIYLVLFAFISILWITIHTFPST